MGSALYLRVSTPGQVYADYDTEGISLSAQRKACLMGLQVVNEYVEAGVSRQVAEHRVKCQKMLARIKTAKDMDHVIVHKLNRLACNWIDEALLMDQFNRLNIALISVTELIDSTPGDQFMRGILSAMAQFRSQWDVEDIAYKMGEKAKNGGTIGKALTGYHKSREIVDSRQVAWYNHPLATEKSKKQLYTAIFEKIYTHYDKASRQAEARQATYSDGIQQRKTMEEKFNRTGTIESQQSELDTTS